MAEYQIPIEYFVNASVVTTQRGLTPLKLSTIAIFTDEIPVIEQTEPYIIARTASTITRIYGTNSETSAQTNIILAQQPNILINNGYVIVAPFNNTSIAATSGTLTTVDLSGNLTALTAVTDGNLNLTVDGTAQNLTGLNLSTATDLTEIANILQTALTGVTVSVNDNQLIFTSNTTGVTSTVTMAASTEETGTDLYSAAYLNGINAETIAGTEAVNTQETLSEAINRLRQYIYFEGVLTTRNVSDSEFSTASMTVQAQKNMVMPLPRSNVNALTGIFAQTQNTPTTKNLLYLTGNSEENAAYNARMFAAAYISRALAVNYSGQDTTLTMNLKDLAGIAADTQISETILNQCETVGADCFPSVEGLPKVVSFSQNGKFFDEITNEIWLVNTIQREVFNVLATVGSKIAQTDPAIEIITKAIRQVCKQAVTNGMAAPGQWNSNVTFGNYEDFMRNISEFGFYIYHQSVTEQSQTERENRQAPVFQVAVKLAGAVHSANVIITIEA